MRKKTSKTKIFLCFLLICFSIMPVFFTGEAVQAKLSWLYPDFPGSISNTNVSINVGNSFELTVHYGKNKPTFKSSNTKVATVDSVGKIYGKSEGTATITVSFGSVKKEKCKVTVNSIKISSVTIQQSLVRLNKGDKCTLTGVVSPSNYTRATQSVQWSSSNTSVATVDQNGVVTGKSNGEAVITFKSSNNCYDTCNIIVGTAIKSITLSPASKEISVGSTVKLKKTIKPSNASEATTWSSSNSNIASVDGNGKVYGKSAGTANIILKSTSGVMGICKITVRDHIKSIDIPQNSVNIKKGNTYKLVPNINPSNTLDQVTWSSSNTSVAKVSKNGVVTAVSGGTAKITVKSPAGVSDSCTVKVTVPLKSLSIQNSSQVISVGSKVTLKKVVSPSDTTETFKWKSSNENVATVNSKGVVTAKKAGKAKITLTASSGKKVTANIDVRGHIQSINIPQTSINLQKGKTTKLTANISPSNTLDIVSWSSNNTRVATVNGMGEVTAVGNGAATITVKSPNGKVTDKCTINVSTPLTSVSLNAQTKEISVGQTIQVVKSISPSDTSETFTWKSSNTNVATVDQNGKVTGKGAGTANIIIAASGGKTASVTITVRGHIQQIDIPQTSINLEKGNTTKLTANITPSNTLDVVTWSSNNTKVATVNGTGYIKAVGNGTATITVKSPSGISDTCTIKVYTALTSVSLNAPTKEISVDQTIQVAKAITPSDTTETFTWKSSNTNVATVDQNGKVTGKGAGTANITITASGGKTASVTITVRGHIQQIDIPQTSISLEKGKTTKLIANITPSNTLDVVTWSSNNTKVATVNGLGEVKAVGGGSAKITVKSPSGVSDSCIINVPDPETSDEAIYSVKTDSNYTVLVSEAKSKPIIAYNKARTALSFYTKDGKKVTSFTRIGIRSGNDVCEVKYDGSNHDLYGLKTGTATLVLETKNQKTYTFNVKVTNIEDNGNSSFAQPISMLSQDSNYKNDYVQHSVEGKKEYYRSGVTYSVSGQKISSTDDIDFYSFNVFSKSTASISIKTSKYVDYYLRLYVFDSESQEEHILLPTNTKKSAIQDGMYTTTYTYNLSTTYKIKNENKELHKYRIMVAAAEGKENRICSNIPYTITVKYDYSNKTLDAPNGGYWKANIFENSSNTGQELSYLTHYLTNTSPLSITNQQRLNNTFWYLTKQQADDYRTVVNYIYSSEMRKMVRVAAYKEEIKKWGSKLFSSSTEYINDNLDELVKKHSNSKFFKACQTYQDNKIDLSEILDEEKFGEYYMLWMFGEGTGAAKSELTSFVEDRIVGQLTKDDIAILLEGMNQSCYEVFKEVLTNNPMLFIGYIEDELDQGLKNGKFNSTLARLAKEIRATGNLSSYAKLLSAVLEEEKCADGIRSYLNCAFGGVIQFVVDKGVDYLGFGTAIELYETVSSVMESVYNIYTTETWCNAAQAIHTTVNKFTSTGICINTITASYACDNSILVVKHGVACEKWTSGKISYLQNYDIFADEYKAY